MTSQEHVTTDDAQSESEYQTNQKKLVTRSLRATRVTRRIILTRTGSASRQKKRSAKLRKSASPNLAVSSMPAFASLEDVLRYFLYEESGLILDAGADKLESSLIVHNLEAVAVSKSAIALTTRKSEGFSGELIVASITSLPFKENAFVRCVCSKGLESLSNTIEVTNALVELSRALQDHNSHSQTIRRQHCSQSHLHENVR